jgi:hypothetical protein
MAENLKWVLVNAEQIGVVGVLMAVVILLMLALFKGLADIGPQVKERKLKLETCEKSLDTMTERFYDQQVLNAKATVMLEVTERMVKERDVRIGDLEIRLARCEARQWPTQAQGVST